MGRICARCKAKQARAERKYYYWVAALIGIPVIIALLILGSVFGYFAIGGAVLLIIGEAFLGPWVEWASQTDPIRFPTPRSTSTEPKAPRVRSRCPLCDM